MQGYATLTLGLAVTLTRTLTLTLTHTPELHYGHKRTSFTGSVYGSGRRELVTPKCGHRITNYGHTSLLGVRLGPVDSIVRRRPADAIEARWLSSGVAVQQSFLPEAMPDL